MKLNLSNLRSDYKLIYKVQPNASMRIAVLIEFVKIEMKFKTPDLKKAKRLKLLALCQGLDISIRTLYRWRAAYIKNGFMGLVRRKAPGRQAKELTDVEQFLIREMREKYRWGSEVIQAHLLRDHSVKLTRYRIERFLTRSGLRDEYPCTTKKVRKKKPTTHTKVVKVLHPGEHTQLDTKHQPHILKNGKKCYVFNFIDHASNWSYKRAYSSLSPKSTIDFMKRLVRECPFKIQKLQTDNGTEYTYKFYKRYADIKKDHPLEKFCEDRDIIQKLIPPGEKELQGLVERAHRQDDQELFSRIEPYELEDFNTYLKDYYTERNKGRRFKKLDWLTPEEWLVEYQKLQQAMRLGHLSRYARRDENLLPKLKNKLVPKTSKQLTLLTNKESVTNDKVKEETVDKIDTKKAA